ncbi:S-layer homology domain-containing protein [Heyndrickxia oleronia]|jgi:predicted DNA-binding antitoxin AbrB/MazE fold protein/tRNA threonylcarbamoyladenosine modification (KEOPS) complex  Pcc1 subunit|uniref:S-layer homology domain-containing protein n=1 Tax=Heyndrickxia oleronia TaxID=38875 RepID=UPI00242F240A|nr:S-layer homology domain-containing protein [Heyndrickxia oleronia]MCI1588975.1 S-layer homology domain-containing protein [Heyndrickxia oleronia]MCI1611934.1 S-layer homology domain-containing protein [Heyndrickxia oleronia]MCI1743060.1 S-layer homology domain-containing protein [Heyndrickxia oleronia]MCI1759554.1 S-layer homology domain-containing protein [Heyndrickxia oleronia]
MAKKSRKVFATTATAALVASAVAPIASSAAGFSDVTKPEYKEAINALADAGILNGYENGTFKPENKVTRGEVAKVITLIRHLEEGTKTPFKDVKDGYWSTKFINSLYAAKLVNGYEDGTFKPEGNVTRAEFAKLVVDAYGLKLTNAATPFTDVKAGNWATPYIQTAYANGLINGVTASKFDPSASIKRGDLALLLYRADSKFGDVIGSVNGVVDGIKATSATTVEVTFKQEVKDVKASNFTIDGLTVENAAVKQTDSKTVVLTTSTQEGGKEYTVKSGANTLGKFKGISAVIPTTIKAETTSVQGVVGKEVTLKADIGVKQAGVPVTFNVKAGDKLNKDQVEEVYTDANGIATYSYTQYAAGNDDVAVYPTGAPSVRSLATVYWGVSQILEIKATDDKKGNSLNNGENKVYKAVYKDPKTGKPIANQKLHVTFAENVGVNIDKVSKATVNGVNPMQLSNGTAPTTAVVTTDGNGEATFTVSGSNTSVTPVVFLDELDSNKNSINTLTATKLQAKTEQVKFGALQAEYTIDVTRDGGEEAATTIKNGRDYNIVVKTKDGKPAANELVNVAFNEDLDRNMNTNTKAYFVEDDARVNNQITVKTDSKGEASFTIASDDEKDYATPIVWIDINSSNAKDGKLDEGEPSKVAPITYFAKAKLVGGVLKAYNADEKVVPESKTFTGLEIATFKYTASNQSGKEFDLPAGYNKIDATFTVFNTGDNNVTVIEESKKTVVAPNRSYTTGVISNEKPFIQVKTGDDESTDKTTSVRVEANGTAKPVSGTNNQPIYLGNHVAKASFVSTKEVGTVYTGLITAINTDKETIQFEGKDSVSYKGATFKNENGNEIYQSTFENHIKDQLAKGKTSKVTLKKDGDKITVSIIESDVAAPQIVQNQITAAKAITDVTTEVEKVVTSAGLETGANLTLPTEVNGVAVNWTSDNNLLSGTGVDVVKAASVDKTTTLVVGDVKEVTNVTLTASVTVGTGSDQVKQTKKFTVVLKPKAEAQVTKVDLLKQIDAANELVKDAKYSDESKATLTDAIYAARVVYDNSSATQADIKSALAGLDTAVKGLEFKAGVVVTEVAVKGSTSATTLTLTFTTDNTDLKLENHDELLKDLSTVAKEVKVEGKDLVITAKDGADLTKLDTAFAKDITVSLSGKDVKAASVVIDLKGSKYKAAEGADPEALTQWTAAVKPATN